VIRIIEVRFLAVAKFVAFHNMVFHCTNKAVPQAAETQKINTEVVRKRRRENELCCGSLKRKRAGIEMQPCF
jgi:hypothetical protein